MSVSASDPARRPGLGCVGVVRGPSTSTSRLFTTVPIAGTLCPEELEKGIDVGSEPNVPAPGEWRGLVTDDDWAYLAANLSAERLGDLLGVLRECPPDVRAEFVAEIRGAAGFRDRSWPLGLARLLHNLESPPSEVPGR